MEWVIGIDEVGRGALAGPVVVVAAAIPRSGPPKSLTYGALKDSKALSAKQREAWFAYFEHHPNVQFALAKVYPRQIEKRNISGAANLAAERAVKKLLKNGVPASAKIFLDGGLFVGAAAKQPKNAKTIIRGDQKISAIKVASIMAKVSRDRLMRRLAKKYGVYGLEIHKGYATKAHRRAIKINGPSDIHRLTFLKPSAIMA